MKKRNITLTFLLSLALCSCTDTVDSSTSSNPVQIGDDYQPTSSATKEREMVDATTMEEKLSKAITALKSKTAVAFSSVSKTAETAFSSSSSLQEKISYYLADGVTINEEYENGVVDNTESDSFSLSTLSFNSASINLDKETAESLKSNVNLLADVSVKHSSTADNTDFEISQADTSWAFYLSGNDLTLYLDDANQQAFLLKWLKASGEITENEDYEFPECWIWVDVFDYTNVSWPILPSLISDWNLETCIASFFDCYASLETSQQSNFSFSKDDTSYYLGMDEGFIDVFPDLYCTMVDEALGGSETGGMVFDKETTAQSMKVLLDECLNMRAFDIEIGFDESGITSIETDIDFDFTISDVMEDSYSYVDSSQEDVVSGIYTYEFTQTYSLKMNGKTRFYYDNQVDFIEHGDDIIAV